MFCMNEAVATLLLLCRLLRPPGAPAASAPAEERAIRGDRWKTVIELANAHYLTPALWLAVQRQGQADHLPGDAREFLAEACRLNRARNERIRAQAVELIEVLNGAEISSVVLKGGAYLFAGDQDAFDTRMMVDLDLLVAKAHLAESFEIAASMGYRVLVEYDPRLHQLDPIGREGDAASVEIHRDAGMQRRILPAEDVFRDAVAIDYEGTRVLIPSPTHRAIHSIFHSEVQSQSNYALRRIPLRYLHDLSLLRRRHDAEIDWEQVQESLSRQGYGYLVPGFLYLANRLLGLPMPVGIPVTAAAKRHYGWCMAQLRWPALRASVSLWGVVAHPFRRPPVEYIYGEQRGPVALQINRLRYARDLGMQHKGGSLAKLSNVFRRMFKA
jgi:putative nucleotidyltransferase-like protein